jgi:hypothetical protein
MKNNGAIKNTEGGTGDITKCSICADYLNSNEAYFCPRCKKGPLCKKHRLPGRKECVSCIFDRTLNEVHILRGQEKNIKSFINFLQFLFIVFAITFIALTFGFLEEIAYLKENLVIKNITYLGIGTAVLLIIFYLVMLNQMWKIKEIETELDKIGGRRY